MPPFPKGNNYGKKFSEDYQPSGANKSLGKQKARALEEIKNSILDKAFKLIDEKLDDPNITSAELQNIFNKAVDMSGFKKDKVDATVKTYSLFEEETEAKANELIERTKKTDKK